MAIRALVLTAVPVTPDGQQARDWLANELAKPEYQSAKPTWFDYLARAVAQWFESLNFGNVAGPSGLGMLVIGVTVLALIVIAFLVFGRPRVNQRSGSVPSLFGENDQRTAFAMRLAADLASQRGDYALAITELFRALATGLAERGVVSVTPGTTAHDFGVRASEVFPPQAAALSEAAATFDGVRYLGRSGAEEQYRRLVALEAALR